MKAGKHSMIGVIQKEAESWKETAASMKKTVEESNLKEDLLLGEKTDISNLNKKKDQMIRDILQSALLFLTLMSIACCIYSMIWFAFVSGSSMNPAYEDGDIIWVNKMDTSPEKGDVILFQHYDGTILVKRVIAAYGDTISASNGTVYVNDNPLDEDYAAGMTEDFDTVVIQEGRYFVMGDNRENSLDSRAFGTIKESAIIGVVMGGE